MAEPARAVCLASPEALPEGDWHRLYFGAEFCPWGFPALPVLQRYVALARDHALPLTLLTPVVYQPFLPVLQKTFAELLPELLPGDEVVVSDLGTLALLAQRPAGVELAIGRVLSGQKRGPRILDLDLNDAEREYFRQGRWYQQEAAAFLAEQGVRRVELDNLLQGLAPLPEPLVGTLHIPYAMVTSSRNCPFRPPGRSGACPGGCGELFRLTTPETPVPLWQAGNTQFIENAIVPENLARLRIDRIVEHQRLPH